jgi:membrane-associated protease RseP (regulator of RpoE activity)
MKHLEREKFKDMRMLKGFPKGEMPKVWTLPDGDGHGFARRAGEGRQIGIGVMPLGKQMAEHFGVRNGVMVENVRENSPAAKAGLKAGDIITEIDGKAVKGQLDLIRGVNEKKEGDVTLTIMRNNSRQTITVTPEKSKDGGYYFRSGDDDLDLPVAPDGLRLTQPPTPMIAPAPMAAPAVTLLRPTRVI